MHDISRFFVGPAVIAGASPDVAGAPVRGPFTVAEIDAAIEAGHLTGKEELCPEGSETWAPRDSWGAFAEGADPERLPVEAGAWRAVARSRGSSVVCAFCLEFVDGDARSCSACGEKQAPPILVPAPSRPPSIVDDPPGASWLRMHWRPALTLAVVSALLTFGIALRHLAPNRYSPPQRLTPAAATIGGACKPACWHGEACQLGRCVWQAPNGVGHLSIAARMVGPFGLPQNSVDVLALDADRYAVASLTGVHIFDSRTGESVTHINDAPQARKLLRVGNVFYAAAAKRIYVIDAAAHFVKKTIEVGHQVRQMALGASGRRVLASMPGARAIAVIATDYHAEVARFHFGDDAVRTIAIDDSGERALTTNGRVPRAGQDVTHATHFGAMYVFDPGRLPSDQDRVRTSMVGNPADVLLAPDSKSSYVLLREKNMLVWLEHLPSGAVRQKDRVKTCRQPEQIELIRDGRRALIRCNAGQAAELFDLKTLEMVRRIPLPANISHMQITPDGKQAVLTLAGLYSGAIAWVDLQDYKLELRKTRVPPSRVRLDPSGKSAVIISKLSNAVWVIQ